MTPGAAALTFACPTCKAAIKARCVTASGKETTPHIQIMADPFAPDPKAPDDKPDALRTEHNQAYGSHREVRDEAGRQVSGPAKMRWHQAGFREHMVARMGPGRSSPEYLSSRGLNFVFHVRHVNRRDANTYTSSTSLPRRSRGRAYSGTAQ